MARRATAIEQLREQTQGALILLDSGDSLFRGGYWATSEDPDQGALLVEAMNAMGYDALALGNMDLDAPLETVQARFEEAQFPIISANVNAVGVLPNVQPSLLRQIGGHTIAIVGVTSEAAAQRSEALEADLTVEDPIAAVSQIVGNARKQADIVILLANLGKSQAEALALAVPGIDAIIGVYQDGQRDPIAIPGAEGQVVLHASGTQGEYLDMLTLHIDAQGQVTDFEGSSLALTDRYADDPQIVEIFRRYASASRP